MKQKSKYARILSTYFSDCYQTFSVEWLQLSLPVMVLLELIQIYEIKILTKFSENVAKTNKKISIFDYFGDLSSILLIDYKSETEVIQILAVLVVYQLLEFGVLVGHFHQKRRTEVQGTKKPPSLWIRLALTMNLLDKMIFAMPVFFFIGQGLAKSSSSTQFFSLGLSLFFILNLFSTWLFDYEYDFWKKRINASYHPQHQYLSTFLISTISGIRGFIAASGGKYEIGGFLVVKGLCVLTGLYLLSDLRKYLHYWGRGLYQKFYLLKICLMVSLGVFELVKDAADYHRYADSDLWVMTILFLVFRLWKNLLDNKEQNLLKKNTEPTHRGLENQEMATLAKKLLRLDEKGTSDGGNNYHLVTYMKAHTNSCVNIFCPCRQGFLKFDYSVSSRDEPFAVKMEREEACKEYKQTVLRAMDFGEEIGGARDDAAPSIPDSQNPGGLQLLLTAMTRVDQIDNVSSVSNNNSSSFSPNPATQIKKTHSMGLPGSSKNGGRRKSFVIQKPPPSSSQRSVKQSIVRGKSDFSNTRKKSNRTSVFEPVNNFLKPRKSKTISKRKRRKRNEDQDKPRKKNFTRRKPKILSRKLTSFHRILGLHNKSKDEPIAVYDPSGACLVTYIDFMFSTRLQNLKLGDDGLGLLYLSFLLDELQNPTLCLLKTHQCMHNFRNEKKVISLKTAIILENYLSITRLRLQENFRRSLHSLNQKSFTQALDYTKKLDKAKRLIREVVDLKIEFNTDLSRDTIKIENLLQKGSKIFRDELRAERMLKQLVDINKTNREVMCLLVNLKLNVKNEVNFNINYYRDLIKYSRHERHQEELITNSPNFSLMRVENMVVLCKLVSKGFRIERFSSNTPEFFDYEPEQFDGILLNRLMPAALRGVHDQYIHDFLNQKSHPMTAAGPFPSFGVSKKGLLREVHLFPKLDYLLSDDVYLAGLMVPAQNIESNVSMVLSEQGEVLAMSNRAQDMLGDSLFEKPYALYYLLPGLLPLIHDTTWYYKDKQGRAGGARKDFVAKSRSTCMFFFRNMQRELRRLNEEELRHSSNSMWSSVSMTKRMVNSCLQKVKKAYLKHKVNFLLNLGNVRRVDVSYSLYQFKHGIRMRYIKLENFKRLNGHHKEFLRIFTKGMKEKPAQILGIDPENLALVKNLLKERKDIDKLMFKLFSALSKSKFEQRKESLVHKQRTNFKMLKSRAELKSKVGISVNGKKSLEPEQPGSGSIASRKRLSSIQEGESHGLIQDGDKSPGTDVADVVSTIRSNLSRSKSSSSLSSAYDPVTFDAEHSIKPMPLYHRKKFTWKRRLIPKEKTSTKGRDGITATGDLLTPKNNNREEDDSDDSSKPSNGFQEMQALRGKPKKRSNRRIQSQILKKVKVNPNAKKRQKRASIVGGNIPEQLKRIRVKDILNIISKNLESRITTLQTKKIQLEEKKKESNMDGLMDNFSNKELKKLFKQKTEEALNLGSDGGTEESVVNFNINKPVQIRPAMKKSRFAKEDRNVLTPPNIGNFKFGKRPSLPKKPGFGKIAARTNRRLSQLKKMQENEETQSVVSNLNMLRRPPPSTPQRSQLSITESDKGELMLDKLRMNFLKNGDGNANLVRNKSLMSATTMFLVSQNIKSKIKRFRLRRLTKQQPKLLFLLMSVMLVVGGALKLAQDTRIEEAALSGKEAVRLVWVVVASGKALRIMMKNKMVLAGMIKTDISPQFKAYKMDVVVGGSNNFERSLYPYSRVKNPAPANSNNHAPTLGVDQKFSSDLIWGTEVSMRIANPTVTGLDTKTVSLGGLMYSVLYRYKKFLGSFDPVSETFEDPSELESLRLWENVIQGNLKLYKIVKNMNDEQQRIIKRLWRESIIALCCFIALTFVIGFFFYCLMLKVERAQKLAKRFFLKMDKKILAKDLTKLKRISEVLEIEFGDRIMVVSIKKQEEKAIDSFFSNKQERGGLNQSNQRFSTERKRQQNSMSTNNTTQQALLMNTSSFVRAHTAEKHNNPKSTNRSSSGSRKPPSSTKRTRRKSFGGFSLSKLNIVANKFNFSRFSTKFKSGNLKRFLFIMVLVVAYNLPAVINWTHYLTLKNDMSELGELRRQNQLRMGFNNIALAIALFRYYQLHRTQLEPDQPPYPTPAGLQALQSIVDPYFQTNYYMEMQETFKQEGAGYIFTRPYCSPDTGWIHKKYYQECLLVTSGKEGYYFATGFSEMLAYYNDLRLNEGNLEFIESRKVWMKGSLSTFNLVHCVQLDNELNLRVEEMLVLMNFYRNLLFFVMVGGLGVLVLGYRYCFFERKEREWRSILATLLVCSDGVLLANAGVRSFFKGEQK